MSENRSGPSYLAVVAIALVSSVVVSAAMVVALARLAPNLFSPPPPAAPTTVEVPSLVRIPRAAASELLTARGLRMVVTEERPDARADEGAIAAQTPLAGSHVDRGSSVSVVVSTGTPNVPVPDIVGRPVAEARAAIERAGLAVGEISESGQGTPGSVSAVEPAVGTAVPPGTRLRLVTVGAGVDVPDVMHQDRRRAQAAITAAGLTLAPVEWRADGDRPPYIVLAQSPAAGTHVASGSAVTLTLNRE